MLSRLSAKTMRLVAASLVIVGVPVLVYLLYGVPELALPSQWADAEAGIADGSLPAGYIVDLIAALLLLAWIGGSALLATMLLKRDLDAGNGDAATADHAGFEPVMAADTPGFEPVMAADTPGFEPVMAADTPGMAPDRTPDIDETGAAESDEPWYRQGPPIFDQPFSDDYPRVVVPPDDVAPDGPPGEPAWPGGAVAAEAGLAREMPVPGLIADDGITDAESLSEPASASADEPPMIVPVRAYYFTRAEDTLRSIAAQFLQTPKRWEELRSLNVASPGVAGMGPDTLLPVGSALALPGDPLPWGKPDPVYLWTLAEKFLFTAWGREPTPEEVVPFWRGLTSGQQLGSGMPSAPPHLAAPPAEVPAAETGFAPEQATPADMATDGAQASATVAPPAIDPSTAQDDVQPPEPPAQHAPAPSSHEPAPAHESPEAPTHEPSTAYDSPVPPSHEPPPSASDYPAAPGHDTPEAPAHEPPPSASDYPAAPGHDTPEAPAHEPPPTYEPPAHEPPIAPTYEPATAYDSPVPPTHEPPPTYEPPAHESPIAPTHEPPPAYDSPVPPTHEPPPTYEPPAHESPIAPTHEPPPAYDSPVPPTHEPPPAYEPPAYESPEAPTYEPATAYDSPVPPTHEPPPGYNLQPPPPATAPHDHDSPVPPAHEPPPPAFGSPVTPTHEPAPPIAHLPGDVDLGPVEPEAPYVEAEAPRMPSFMPSLTGADTAATAPEAQVVTSSNRSLAGTAIGDAMMLWQISRIRRRGGRQDEFDPMEESLKQNARIDSLNLIEAAMRHLRAVTVGQLREKPSVLAVRVGTYGFEVLLNRPVQAPHGWQAASGGYVLELPPGVTADDLDAAGQGPTLCPALVPVGDTVEGPLLLNIEEIGCLIVTGPASPSVNLLNAVVGTLGSSPLAADIRIITVGMETPVGVPGWDGVHSTSFDSPQLEELISTAHTGGGAPLDILVVGPGNDLLIQRVGQVASTPGSRLALVGATSSVAARWPWRIHLDETTTAVVHPIACTMAAAQAMAPALSQLLSEAADPSLLAPPRF